MRLNSRPEPKANSPEPAIGHHQGIQGDEALSKQSSSEIPYSGEKLHHHQ
ncbi:hypothetical protein A2U01_0085952, partial [Trifolium medium]|nr:hypothetical protein [Trifolium medium]